ncbi:hypothetical protein PROFUN_05691 [Planoprotostelium fungivorum]|uniref:RING-type domain-containing protein n=1 Tax=Planoprotostelium fungivorum TaxID=1890364 RepID=A0A2P6NQE7_9EUKA|nr:hypothetical protein PROFUN_05691 [Planoprotostelium fungivorum]
MGTCPLCNKAFAANILEQHASECCGEETSTIDAGFIDLSTSPSSPQPQNIKRGRWEVDRDTSYTNNNSNIFCNNNGYSNNNNYTYSNNNPKKISQSDEDEDRHMAMDIADQEDLEKKRREEEESLLLARQIEASEEEEILRAKRMEEELNHKLLMELMESEAQQRAEQLTGGASTCTHCKSDYQLSEMYYLEKCTHMFCKKCLREEVMNRMASKQPSRARCLDDSCRQPISPIDIKELLEEADYREYERLSTEEAIDRDPNMIRCPKCRYPMEKISDNHYLVHGEKTDDGEAMSEEAEIHRSKNRFRCRECDSEFCAECKHIPYHNGYTCEQYVEYAQAKHCRYCQAQLQSNADVCNEEECKKKSKEACRKKHRDCGHPCDGIYKESPCLPCLYEDCQKQEGTQKREDFCNICWTEELGAAPCIRLDCGHIFHSHCVKEKIDKKWSGARITFGFLDCPLCKQSMKHPSIEKQIDPMQQLHKHVSERAVERLKLNHDDKNPVLSDVHSQFYENVSKYAMYKYSYFPCSRCKKPYFGGERACEAEREYKPEELVCPGCTAPGSECPTHGNEYIEYKCKFCCSMAVWYCWGSTHFCEACHQQATVISVKPRHQLPACNCNKKHPPNGEEYCMGCTMCHVNDF